MAARRGLPRGLTLALVAVLAVAGCAHGGEETSSAPEADDTGPVHVHGLGVNPADGALFIATHTGLFRAPRGEPEAERVGESYQDTMGFTVVGADRFLGSGHPDAREISEGEPPLLGLIESRDAGEHWRRVSLSGQADFHVLRYVRGRIYGYDATSNRILVSRDSGRTWMQRTAPAPLIDLVVDPASASRLLAVAGDGLYRSRDGGASWLRVSRAAGFLAWPSTRRLLLVDGRGSIFASTDGGRAWDALGTVGGEPSAFIAVSERDLYAALHDGTVKRSRDGGRSWSVRSAP